jgi:hypothetical protein
MFDLHDERRDFMRMKMDCDIRYAAAGSEPSRCGHLHDLSATGLQFICAEQLEVGAELAVLINPPGENNPPLRGAATVLRCEKGDEGYQIGCKLMIDS